MGSGRAATHGKTFFTTSLHIPSPFCFLRVFFMIFRGFTSVLILYKSP